MLRVGLTGNLASGKSTAAHMFAAHGANVLSSDEMARAMMQPGQPVYDAIVARFGPEAVAPDGSLDRAALARLAFGDGLVEELSGIVHPQVLACQEDMIREIAAKDSAAVIMVESALIFEPQQQRLDGWQKRFDKVILVSAPRAAKIARFVDRVRGQPVQPHTNIELDAEQRLARQAADEVKALHCDYILTNQGTLAELQAQVDALWPLLQAQAVESKI